MTRPILYLFLILILSSCGSNLREKERLIRYNEVLLTFTPNQVSHFPHDMTQYENWGFYAYYPKSTVYNNKAGLIFTAQVDSASCQKLKRDLEYQNFTMLSMNNDSLIVIGDTINNYSSIRSGYPIPSFIDVKDQFGISDIRLKNRGQIFIIEAVASEFLDEKNLVTGLKLPENWRHGYSRGIVTDEVDYKIIYWLVLW